MEMREDRVESTRLNEDGNEEWIRDILQDLGLADWEDSASINFNRKLQVSPVFIYKKFEVSVIYLTGS